PVPSLSVSAPVSVAPAVLPSPVPQTPIQPTVFAVPVRHTPAPVAPLSPPPVPAMPSPAVGGTPPAPRPKAQDKRLTSRRAFVVSLVGLAALGGGGAWLLAQRLSPPDVGSTSSTNNN